MKLSSLQEQTNSKGQTQSGFIINVDYNEVEHEVDSVISVQAYDYKTGTVTDLTYIFTEQYEAALDEMILRVDWNEIYLAQKPEEEPPHREMANNLFNEMCKIAYSSYIHPSDLNKYLS